MKKLLLLWFIGCNIINSAAQKNILFEENFEDNYLRWLTGHTPSFEAKVANGVYALSHKVKNSTYYFWQSVPIHTDTSFYIEAIVQPQKELANGVYGLLWGLYDAQNYNAFLISNTGKASVIVCRKGRIISKKNWVDLANYQKGKKEKLGIQYQGGQLHFYYNETAIFSTAPLSFQGGFLGFILADQTAINVDRIRVKQDQKINLAAGVIQGLEKENLGHNINSTALELHPIIAADGQHLYFTRKGHTANIGGQGNDDAWQSSLQADGTWGLAQPLGQPINNEYHNQVIAVSADNNTLLVGSLYHADGRFKGEGISITHRQNDGQWEVPQAVVIDSFYNQNTITSLHLSANESVLILSLERQDSRGHLDLYVSFKQSNGHFSSPQNMGSTLNTMYEEGTPFLAADNQTLYFCSAGHGGYGATDIFVSKRLDDSWFNWSKPLNLGAEINSRYWEGYYSITAAGDKAYLVSNQGKNHIGLDDIYKVVPPLSVRPEPVVLVKGKVLDIVTKAAITTKVFCYEKATKKEQAGALSDPKSGHYQMILPSQKKYNFLSFKEGYYPYSKALEIKKIEQYTEIIQDIALYPLEAGQTIPLLSSSLGDSTNEDLARLAFFMQKYPSMQIAIHDSSALVVEQIKSYLVSKNIATERIETAPKKQVSSFTIQYLDTEDTVLRVGDFDAQTDIATLKKGYILKLNQLHFEADSTTITLFAEQQLKQLYQFLVQNQSLKIEIGGHTNALPPAAYCNQLSKQRAKNIANYLIKKGIAATRIDYKGYGKTQPIATNKTLGGRKQNQRVEIKILAI